LRKVIYPKVGGVDSIRIVEADDPVPGPGQVTVRIHRAGINFADLMMRQGLYGSNPEYPFTPGYEAAGEVIEAGDGVEGLQSGDRVLAMTGFGGYSEQIALDASRVIPLPDSISFDQAAAIPVTYGTAYHMLVHLGNLTDGETVLIHHAAGGVGTAVAQICKAYGASLVVGVGAVQPLTHHQVREVDSCPVHPHSYLAGTGHRVRVLDNSDAVDATDSRIDHFAHSITHQVVCGGLAALEMLENDLQALLVVRQGVPGALRIDYTRRPPLAVVKAARLVDTHVVKPLGPRSALEAGQNVKRALGRAAAASALWRAFISTHEHMHPELVRHILT
jgi:hypothetical protein